MAHSEEWGTPYTTFTTVQCCESGSSKIEPNNSDTDLDQTFYWFVQKTNRDCPM